LIRPPQPGQRTGLLVGLNVGRPIVRAFLLRSIRRTVSGEIL